MTVHETIKSRMGEFTAAEAAFARYVLVNDDLIFKSITLVTEDSAIGYGTIIRFCQKLGYVGFQDFKIHLAVDAKAEAPETGEAQTCWLARRGEMAQANIANTIRSLDESTLEAAACLLAGARSTLIAGVAGSFPVAMELSYRMTRLGLFACAEPDTHLQVIKASLMKPGDALFTVSSSGSTKELIECARQAKERGAKVVLLTNHAKSPLANYADITIAASVWEGVLQAEVGTKLPLFLVVELLGSLLLKMCPDAEESVRLSSDSVAARLI